LPLEIKLWKGRGLGCHWPVDLRHILCACPEPGTRFPTSFVVFFFIFNDLRRAVSDHFCGYCWIVDHQCLNIILILITYSSLIVKTLKRHVLSNGENKSVFKIKKNMWIKKFVVEKRLKHKIQNTSVQTICRNTRPKRNITLAMLKVCKDGIRWMASLNLLLLCRQNLSLRSRNWLFHSEWG
jgi:hypothetical protein